MRDAWQWHGEDLKESDPDWVALCTEPGWSPLLVSWTGFTGGLIVWTSRGRQAAKPNDWIVRVNDEVLLMSDAARKALV